MNAITFGNALIFSSPSSKQQHVTQKQRQWKRFVDGLDWDKLQKQKEKPSVNKLVKVFRSLGIPVRKQKKKGDK